MPRPKPTTIAGYIKSAPPAARPHLRKLHAILRSVAPDATETIKWNVPFFIEPRFLFSFSAFKAHCVLAPTPEALKKFRKELTGHKTTKMFLQIPYDEPVPEKLIRRIAEYRVRAVRERPDEGFW